MFPQKPSSVSPEHYKPLTATSSQLSSLLPPWFCSSVGKAAAKRLACPTQTGALQCLERAEGCSCCITACLSCMLYALYAVMQQLRHSMHHRML